MTQDTCDYCDECKESHHLIMPLEYRVGELGQKLLTKESCANCGLEWDIVPPRPLE